MFLQAGLTSVTCFFRVNINVIQTMLDLSRISSFVILPTRMTEVTVYCLIDRTKHRRVNLHTIKSSCFSEQCRNLSFIPVCSVHIHAACRREWDVISHLCPCKDIHAPVEYLGLNICTLIALNGWKKTS